MLGRAAGTTPPSRFRKPHFKRNSSLSNCRVTSIVDSEALEVPVIEEFKAFKSLFRTRTSKGPAARATMVSNVVTGNHGDRLRAGGPTPPPVTRDSQLENLGNVIPTFHILSRYMDGDVKITPVSGPLGCQFQPHSDYPHIPSRIQGYPLTYSGMTRNERVTIFGLWRCTVCISKVASADFCIFCISIA